MRRKYMGLAILMTALLLGGCASTASGTDETTAAAQTTVEETSSAAETAMEAVEEESTEKSTEGSSLEETTAETGVVSEEETDEFLTLMDNCADAAPGTAGTSLRTAAAAAGLLDWEEELADSLSEECVKEMMASWKEARTDDDWAYLQESWSQVEASMREIAADPEGQAALVEDAGYTLGHTSYQTDVMEMVIGAIEEALSE
ncbi:MAG: hypothetical protein LUF00_13635 [Lachnospiraceae bacterium]|nr:hypothetical protein [Lachnospiraceae bacterium]